MLKSEKKGFMNNLNYKDFLIIFSIWYFIIAFNYLLGNINFEFAPRLTQLIHFLFIVSGRFIFLTLILFYLVSLYTISFSELGLTFTNLKKQLFSVFLLIIFFYVIIILFVNIPLTAENLSTKFDPLYKIGNSENLIRSMIPFVFIIIPGFIIALSEQFILNNFIYGVFNFKLPSFLAVIFSSLFYSFFILSFDPKQILVNFFVAFISIYLYNRFQGSLYSSTLFMAAYYAIYICYIYGWDYFKF